jgi:SAM-dependent methyltransferase
MKPPVQLTKSTVQIPLWKKWLSYLRPITLEETGSEQNLELTVVLDRGRLQLLAGNAIYSWDDLYRNFRVAFEELDLGNRKLDDVLLLGLGLASVPYILEKKHGKTCHYLAIEADEEIARLALEYSLPRLKSYVEVVTADAEMYVEICEEQFDMVVMDIFEDDLTPPQFETREFLENCAARVRPGGLLLFNRLHHTLADRTATERFYKNTFQTVFPAAEKIDTGGNWILFVVMSEK